MTWRSLLEHNIVQQCEQRPLTKHTVAYIGNRPLLECNVETVRTKVIVGHTVTAVGTVSLLVHSDDLRSHYCNSNLG